MQERVCQQAPTCQQDPCQTRRGDCICERWVCTYVEWGGTCIHGDALGQYKITHNITGIVAPNYCLFLSPDGVLCPSGGTDLPRTECVTGIR
ncbi:hypothetical protein [Sorangium cellulosum]|uniref:hypothetical protein n=1 Tax=Sorangium cellulosum TaxID=56 RepID=UPI001331A643|nr:hypothetical protein [Sorangium cellulosum]